MQFPIKNLDKKLKNLESKRRKELNKWIKESTESAIETFNENPEYYDSVEHVIHNHTYGYKNRLNNPLNDILPLRYLKRRGVFVNYKESCMFNPMTGYGNSYHWYMLSNVIKGKLVLNTYPYSSCTNKHISKFRELFKLLGLKYIEIQAPSGLQLLDVATEYTAELYAKREVEHKYARKPFKGHKKAQEKLLNDARSIGLKFPRKMLSEAVMAAEAGRKNRLERLREKRKSVKEHMEVDKRVTSNPCLTIRL